MAVKCILTGQTPSVLDGVTENVQTQLNGKVDKVTGKGLSTNDYTSAEKTKLSGIETGAQKNTIIGVKGSAETTYRTGNVNITATNIGLGNVDNTSDANKPISNATQAALNDKQSKITANGILKGDGTGTITAADETEVELVDITPELIGAQPKITANGFLTSDGEGNVAAEQPVLTVEVWLRDAPTPGENPGEYIYNFASNYNYEQIRSAQRRGYMVVVYYSGDIFYYTGENSNDGLIFSKIGEKYSTCSYDRLRCTSDDKWHRESYTLVSEEGIFPAANGRFTLPEIIQNLENETESIKEKTKSIYLPTASWTGSDPYTQTITYSFPTNAKVNIQPSERLYDQLVADSVSYLAIKNVDGTFTAVAKGGKPSVNLDVQVTYNNVH